MKKSIHTLLMAAAMIALPFAFTSCDDLFGEWSRPASVVVTPTDPEPTPDATPTETVVKATDLLKEAQKDGATVVIWYYYEGNLYYVVFKKVGDEYVRQKSAAGTRGEIDPEKLIAKLRSVSSDEQSLQFDVEQKLDEKLDYIRKDADSKLVSKIITSSAKVEQKTVGPETYLAGVAANIQDVDIENDTKIMNAVWLDDSYLKGSENVMFVTPDNSTNQLLLHTVGEIVGNGKEQGMTPKESIKAAIENGKLKIAEDWANDISKMPEIKFENKKPSVTWSPTASENTYTQALKTEGEGTVTYSIDDISNTCGAKIDSKTGEVTFEKPGQVIVSATFTDTSKFEWISSYFLTVNQPKGGFTDYNLEDDKNW